MPQSHLLLEVLELLRVASSGLGAHLLTGPLKGAVNLLCEMHLSLQSGPAGYYQCVVSDQVGSSPIWRWCIRGVVWRRRYYSSRASSLQASYSAMDETNDGRDEEERRLTGSSSRGGASDGVMNQIPAARGWVKQQGRLCLSRGELQSTYSGGVRIGRMRRWVHRTQVGEDGQG